MNIIDIASEHSRAHGDASIHAVHVRVGRLSGVVSAALSSAFEVAREETPLAGAKLVVEEVPVKLNCPQCGQEQLADSIQLLCCRVCGSISSEVTQGRDLEIVALELEVDVASIDVPSTDVPSTDVPSIDVPSTDVPSIGVPNT